MKHAVAAACLPLALLVAGAVFWFGPSAPVPCSDRAAWMDHYGHVDGAGGPGFRGCLAPSTANYVLSSTALVVISAAGVLIDAVRGLPRGGGPAERRRVYLDAAGNVQDPPAAG